LKTSGPPVQVLKDLASQRNYGIDTFDVGPTGALIYSPGGDQTEVDAIRWLDRTGKIAPSGDGHYFQMDISRDDRRLTLGIGEVRLITNWTETLLRQR